MELTILSWNIMHGGGSRIFAIAETIFEINPHFIILSEFKANPAGYQILDFLGARGYAHAYYHQDNKTENSVLVIGKMPGTLIAVPYLDSELFTKNIVAVDYGAFALIGVYLPHKKKHNLFDSLLAMNEKYNHLFIIAGDFNSGINHIDQEGNSFWYEKELKQLHNAGMVDAFRHMKGEQKEYSWYSHQGNGFRYDHTLVNENLIPLVKSCEYYHKARLKKTSDHSPMILTLSFG